jgi:hypothetical protein
MESTHVLEKPRIWLLAALIGLLIVLLAVSLRERLSSSSRRPFLLEENALLATTPIPSPPVATNHKTRRNILLGGVIGLVTVLITLAGLVLAQFLPAAQFPNSKAQSGKSPTAKTSQLLFESGVIYPRWQANAYSLTDTAWQTGVQTMKEQTAAHWIEMPVLFSQATADATEIVPSSQSTPTLAAFVEGVHSAHALGYHVFFVPLMQVRTPGDWSGSIQLPTNRQQAWFDAYWQAIQPYVQAAAESGVEQMAIGTELQWLQQYAPAALWTQLISRERALFKGVLTYDMNWSSLAFPLVSWLKDPDLGLVGVSSYIPLLDTAKAIEPDAISALWSQKVKSKLDTLASEVGKRVLISEIGYRNSSDTLYQTWLATTSAPPDPQLQAAAYDATLSNTFSDPQIAGTFFWGWDNVGRFAIKGQPAVQTLDKWYSLPQAA